MTTFAAGAATDVGQVRTVNQDHTLVGANVFAVADGMGGHRGGEVASAVAIEALVNSFTGESSMALADAVRNANAAVVERAAADPELRGMGTTMCALASVHDEELGEVLSIVNVGDSRAYLLRAGQDTLDQISEDHSLVQQLVRQGQLTPDDAANHPQRNIVTRALGIDPEVKPDVWVLTPVQGDRYLLCSDGLFNEVDEAVIAQVLRERTDPDDAVNELVRLANEGGGRDNISVVVVDILDDEGSANAVPDERVVDIVRAGDRPLNTDIDTHPTAVQPVVPGPDDAPGEAGGHGAVAHAGADVTSSEGAAADATAVAAGGAVALDTAAPSGPHVVVDRPPVAPEDPAVLVPPTLTPVRRRTRITWRVLLFFVVLAAIVAGFVYVVNWVSTNTFFVTTDAQQQVVIYQGRPGGFLWNEPTVVRACGFGIDQVSSEFRDDVAKGRDQPSLADAEAYCTRIRPTTTTTTTTTSTTATTVQGGAGIPGLDPAAPTSIAP